MPSDLLSTDARCLVIILDMQCNRCMVDFYRATLCMPSSCICPSVCLPVLVCLSHSVLCENGKCGITQIMPHDWPVTLVFKWDVLYHSCRISTDKRVARSLCHSRVSCYKDIILTACPACLPRQNQSLNISRYFKIFGFPDI